MKFQKGDIITLKQFKKLADNKKIIIECYALAIWETFFEIAKIEYI